MDRGAWHDLEGLFAALAKDAVLVQRRLDEAHAEASEAFARSLADLPAPARNSPLALALAPRRLVVDRHEIRCAVRVATARSLELKLVARPINLGASALFGRSEAQEMSLCVEIEPAPVLVPRTPTT